MAKRVRLLGVLAALVVIHAGAADQNSGDAELERRVMAISEELRCLVCQNQSLADSHAELAIDLRNQVREQLQLGKSERQVVDYLVDRYGDFVRYRPPVRSDTALLWFGPFALLVAGLGGLVFALRKRRAAGAATTETSGDEYDNDLDDDGVPGGKQ